MRFVSALFSLLVLMLSAPAYAQEAGSVLYENVRIFDGHSAVITVPSNVLVVGDKIKTISTEPIEAADAVVIEGAGRVLMPGLIDAHWHTMLIRITPEQGLNNDVGYTTMLAAAEAKATLMRGFTTVRDMGGYSFSLKRAIDEGVVEGPRIYPSGAMISVTSGHGDFRQLSQLPRRTGELSRMEELGMAMIADSPDEVRMRVREQLMLGASQVKLTAGGGVSSPFSPLDVSTFTLDELTAAVEAADNWGTYVAVHAYTPVAIQLAVAAGVKVIEHAHLLDEATAKLMADKGIWLSTQPFDAHFGAETPRSESGLEKLRQVVTGTDNLYRWARQYGIKTAFGTDILFSAEAARNQGSMLALLTNWYTPAEALEMATGTNGELLQLTGLRNPYPGKLGVVEEGALADLLLVNGDPLEDIELIADPDNFVVIMKGGKVFKNTLEK